MSNKHTPGPWHVVDNGHYFEIVVPWNSMPHHVDQYCPKICDVSYEGNDEIRGENNVSLIAAAPDLLEALQEAIETIKAMSCKDLSCDPPEDVSTLEAAIAKATGANNG